MSMEYLVIVFVVLFICIAICFCFYVNKAYGDTDYDSLFNHINSLTENILDDAGDIINNENANYKEDGLNIAYKAGEIKQIIEQHDSNFSRY